jgi:hypothetical protein
MMRKRTAQEPVALEELPRSRHLHERLVTPEAPHRLEQAVQRRLLAHPDLRFSSLVIRRIPNGVCLEGVLENQANLDVSSLARSVAGVEEVLNHLVVRRPADG